MDMSTLCVNLSCAVGISVVCADMELCVGYVYVVCRLELCGGYVYFVCRHGDVRWVVHGVTMVVNVRADRPSQNRDIIRSGRERRPGWLRGCRRPLPVHIFTALLC